MSVVKMASGLHPLKIGVVGDSMVGKTCLIGSAFNFPFIIVLICIYKHFQLLSHMEFFLATTSHRLCLITMQ